MKSHEAEQIIREIAATSQDTDVRPSQMTVKMGDVYRVIKEHSHKTILEWLGDNFG